MVAATHETPPASTGGRNHIVLALPPRGRFAPVVRAHFLATGHDVQLREAPLRALETLREPGAALLILDAALPEAQETVRQAKVEPATNGIPVIALFPHGRAPLRPTELRVQADLELTEPFEVRQLLEAAERLAARPRTREAIARLIFPSHQADLDRSVDLIAELFRASGLDEEARTSLLTAYREAATNAVQHGNRYDRTKCVRVEYRHTPESIAIEVRDQGDGFAPQSYLHQGATADAAQAARDRSRQGGQGGLGILMIVRCTDRVDYNDKGNAVTLVRHLVAPPDPEIAQEDATP